MRIASLAAVAAIAVATGCGGGGSGPTGTMNNNPPPPTGNGPNVSIQNYSFMPKTDTVKVGTTVTWTNNDVVAHRVFSDSLLWDSGQLAPPSGGGTYGGSTNGASFSFTFSRTGSFSYHCQNHPPSAYPNFTGTIVVTE